MSDCGCGDLGLSGLGKAKRKKHRKVRTCKLVWCHGKGKNRVCRSRKPKHSKFKWHRAHSKACTRKHRKR